MTTAEGEFFAWLLDLFVKHPITFILTVPVSAYLTYVIIRFVNDDINARNRKQGHNPGSGSAGGGSPIFMVVFLLFGGLSFGIYSLINWIGSTLLAAPNF